MAKHISDRIRAAIEPQSRLADVRTVLAEVRKAHQAAIERGATAEEKRDDPTTSASDAAQARLDAEEHKFEARRMARAIQSLEERITSIEAADAARQKKQLRDAIVARRDALAAKLRDRVPPLLDELATLLKELDANNAEIKGSGLESAEAIARGLPAFGFGTHPPSLCAIRIPHFGKAGFAWPIDRMATALARMQETDRQSLLRSRAENTPEALAAKAMKEAARYTRYTVEQARYAGHPVGPVLHRDGKVWIHNLPAILHLTDGQVEAARKLGMKVEPAGPEWQTYEVSQAAGREKWTSQIDTRDGTKEIGAAAVQCVLNETMKGDAMERGLLVKLLGEAAGEHVERPLSPAESTAAILAAAQVGA
jgi:hypothetical protein